MFRMPVGRCSSCDAPVSYFARFCPYCHASNLPNPVVIGTALLAVVLVGGAITLGALYAPRGKKPAQEQPQSEPKAEAAEDYGWIVKAMAECDETAKRSLDVLRFLILPLTNTNKALAGWRPSIISMAGDRIQLISATDALIGLRNGAMALYPKEVTFAVSDPKTNTTYKWKPAVGVSELTTRETSFESLKLGFQVAEIGDEIVWGPTINIETGTCYWTNPLILPPAPK
jgi:hypothetical protein